MRYDPRVPEPGLTTLPWLIAVIVATVILLGARISWGDCIGTCEHNYRQCVKACIDAGADTKCDRKCDEKQEKCKAKCPTAAKCEEQWGRDMDRRGRGAKPILDANWRYDKCMDKIAGAEGPTCGKPPLPPCQPAPRPEPKPQPKA